MKKIALAFILASVFAQSALAQRERASITKTLTMFSSIITTEMPIDTVVKTSSLRALNKLLSYSPPDSVAFGKNEVSFFFKEENVRYLLTTTDFQTYFASYLAALRERDKERAPFVKRTY